MGNENERKRNPADNRKRAMGHQWDDAKAGGEDEDTVGLTNDRGFGEGGGPSSTGVGSVGVVGGSAEFLSEGKESSGEGTTPETSKSKSQDRGAE